MSPTRAQAVREMAHELAMAARRQAVDAEKARLLARKPFWHRLFPFTVNLTITRRKP